MTHTITDATPPSNGLAETVTNVTSELVSSVVTELVDDQPPIDLSNAENVMLAFRQLRDAQSRIAEERATAESMRAKIRKDLEAIDEWERTATARDVSFATFLTAQLEIHMRHRRAADPECKSIKTPWGEITSRAQDPEYTREEVPLREWAQSTGFMRPVKPVEPDVDWAKLKKACHVKDGRLIDPEGEVVPGVKVVEKPFKIDVEIYGA